MLLRTRTMLVLTSLAVFTPAAALHAQACCYAPRRHSNYGDQSLPSFQITPYAGYMNFGRYINGPLGSQIPFANGPVVGGQASLSLTKNFALYGDLGWANSNNHYGTANPYVGFGNANSNGMWFYDGGIQLMAPFHAEDRHWVVPFVQVGAGAVTYRLSDGFNSHTDTRFAWNGGVGLDYHFTRQVGIRLMAKDYLATFNVPAASPSMGGVIDQTTTNNNNWTFNVGLNLGF
jgi:hypothetical protein